MFMFVQKFIGQLKKLKAKGLFANCIQLLIFVSIAKIGMLLDRGFFQTCKIIFMAQRQSVIYAFFIRNKVIHMTETHKHLQRYIRTVILQKPGIVFTLVAKVR